MQYKQKKTDIWITYDKAPYKNEQLFAPFQTNYYSICTQKHGPWNHSDMIALPALCKQGSLQDDMTRGKDVYMQAPSPEWRHFKNN
jgi:hypothetical protein